MTALPSCVKGVGRASLSHRLNQFVRLAPDDLAALDELLSIVRAVAHNREIVTQGRKCDGLMVMLDGVSVRYRILRDGRRQVLNVALPGDVIGFPACFFEAAPYSISALTDITLSCIPFNALGGLFDAHPRLSAALFCSFSSEAAIYVEHLTDVGRRTALERVAHFLLELLHRFQTIGHGDDRSFPMPLTQELIADALGLSVPHVNRMLKQLRDDNLVRIESHQVIVADAEALSVLADFEESYLGRFRTLDVSAARSERACATPVPAPPR